MKILALLALLLAGTVARAHAGTNEADQPQPGAPIDKSAQQSGSDAPATPATGTPSVTVTGKAPHSEPALPTLPPDEFTDCMQQNGYDGFERNGVSSIDPTLIIICASKMNWERHIIIDKCINADRKFTAAVVVQACTESLDHKILEGSYRQYIFVNRAEAYLAQGDKVRALDDYNSAIAAAPKNSKLYYNRALFYSSQTNTELAERDLDIALSINPKFAAALHQRAKLFLAQDDIARALGDCSESIRLEPKNAGYWSQRGYVNVRKRDFASAVKDETEAIRLDPKLARAYFLRGAAFGDLGDSRNALSDIVTAVDLDPSLDRYISTKGKTASIALPPL